MKLEFLATGDLQIHKWKQFSYVTKSGMNSRLRNCLNVLKFMRKTAIERGVSKLFYNGDILEECDFIDVEVWDAVYTELEKASEEGLENVINLGNHDVHGESAGRVLHALRGFRGVSHVVEEPTLVWNHLQVVPWMSSPDRLKAAIRNLKAGRNMALALHCGVQGAVTGPTSYLVRNPIKLRDIRYKEFGLVLLSDYHTRQRLAKNPEVWYLGSPIQHSFGEVHRPSIWHIRLDKQGLFRCEKLYTNFPRFRRVSASDESELLARTEKFKNDYVEVRTSHSGKLTDVEIQRVAEKVGFHVRIVRGGPEEREEFQTGTTLSIQKAMKKYVSRNSGDEKLLRLGWKIMNGEI